MPVSKLRVDDSVHHGQTRTRDAKVVVLRRQNLQAYPPTRPITILSWWDAGVYYMSCAVELMCLKSPVSFLRCSPLLLLYCHQTQCFL